MARQLRAAGHLVYLAIALLPEGVADEVQLEAATNLGAVLISKDLGDFPGIHEVWQANGREHAGIVTCRELEFGRRFQCLERAARLLTPAAARNHLLNLDMFASEAMAQAHATAFTPPVE